ncbi:radical SAM family heme chaperone HemW [Limibacter armeniacum]|uniref:radical SAM family heme chaperone HemW n=1 Tax=Limibacter armeniacum TaxID=466084 RepID=UPI002FE57FC4
MAGIYIHIPFCKQACHYCDFHFSTNMQLKTDMVEAIRKELEMQKDYVQEPIRTLYFGGGTPSLLSETELNAIIDTVNQYYDTSGVEEITLEANPDDLKPQKLKELRNAGINRLSIGIQSFHGPHLKFMNRAHNAKEAEQCVKLAQDAGFENMTIDLIYAVPADDHSIWERDLNKAISLNVPHISSYCLTIEEKTAFGNWAKKGKIKPAGEEFAAEQFEMLVNGLTGAGYEHYEISNFAKPGLYSKHNTAYWQQQPYIGIGPGAHSYNGNSRQYNVSNNPKYIHALKEGTLPFEKEVLSVADQVNEYMMVRLRTMWGCDLSYLKERYNVDLKAVFAKELAEMEKYGWLTVHQNMMKLTEKGKLLADKIAGDLFID